MNRLLARIEAALLDRHARNVVMAAAKAAVRCPYSGLSITRCKAGDICDCFDYPDERDERGD